MEAITLESLLGYIRLGFTKLAEIIASILPFEAQKIYIILVIGASLFLAGKLINWIPTIRDSWIFWFALTAILTYVIGFL